MATIASATSGNWSSTSTWDGGVLPGVNDIAQVLTGHTVTIDQDISVQSLSNTGSGKFVLTGSTPRVITCSVSMSLATTATGSLLEIDSSYSATGTEITTGNILIGAHTGSGTAAVHIVAGATGSIDFYGDQWRADTSTTGNEPPVLLYESDVDITITLSGSMIGSPGYCIEMNSSGSIDITLSSLSGYYFLRSIGSWDRSITINGNLSTGNYSGFYIYQGTCNIIVNGDITGGTSSSGYSIQLYRMTESNVIVNGNVTGGTGGGTGIYVQGFGSEPTFADITVNGYVRGGSSSTASKAIEMSSGNVRHGDLHITQSVESGVGGAPGVNWYSAGTIEYSNVTIDGDVSALLTTSTSTTQALAVTGNTNLTIYGNIYGGNSLNTRGVSISTGGIGILEGSVFRAGNAEGSSAVSSNEPVKIGKIGQTTEIINNSLALALSAQFMIEDGAGVLYRFTDAEANDLRAALSNLDSSLSPSDVRDGIVYDSDDKVGTMAVPDPAEVYLGVPVDNTVGTASIKLSDAAAITGSQISSLSS